MNWLRALACTCVFFNIFLAAPSWAWTEKSIDPAASSAFKPNDLSLEHFYLETSLPWSWVPGSFEWVRIDHRFLIPRGRVRIQVPPSTPVKYRGQTHLSSKPEIEIPVALTQETGNEIELLQQKIPIRFKMNHPLKPALVIDTSCSSAPIRFRNLKLEHSWVGIYCSLVRSRNETGSALRMDVHLFWESESRAVTKLNQQDLPTPDGLTYSLSLNSSSPPLHLENGPDSFDLIPKLPDLFHALSFSIGLGPYLNQEHWRPFATLYTSYLLSDQIKLASFVALPLKNSTEIDLGLYGISEQFKALDERLSMNLLLGAHALSFTSAGSSHFALSFPQGVEFIFRDFLQHDQSLMLGGFFYPAISDRSYINTWIRYGNSRFFLELNYIRWKEPVPSGSYEAKSMGFSLGFPLFRAL